MEKLLDLLRIHEAALASDDGHRCMIAPSPELREKLKNETRDLESKVKNPLLISKLKVMQNQPVGMNDGVIYPGSMFPIGTGPEAVRKAAANRAPLRGNVNVIVVLVDFSDKAMVQTTAHFDQLFFSEGVLPNGSVKEYFSAVTNNLVTITGQVVGPYRLPLTLAAYCHGDSGTGSATPNARTMAYDAAVAANPHVNYGPYDNDGDGFVDAFIVIHAGSGAEQTGSVNDIWSHKWVLAGGAYTADTTKIYAYLTVPEDARIGVCCHELGHLLFGFPDLYDTDYSSEGVGNWCLMAGGSWNGGGNNPAHPCAWCKADQGWVNVVNQTNNGLVNIEDVKTGHTVYRLWKDGAPGTEYFLVENRQRTGYDSNIPGDGLLIWHVDESISSNSDESHYKVALMQADGLKNLENGDNRGDGGDSYPGTTNNKTFDKASTPNSKSYGGVDTCVAVKNIPAAANIMQAELNVKCITKSLIKDFKDTKRRDKVIIKERKEFIKEKELFKESKEWSKEKPEKEIYEKSATSEGKFTDWFAGRTSQAPGAGGGGDASNLLEEIYSRLARIEAKLSGGNEPFIPKSLRPDLDASALSHEDDPWGNMNGPANQAIEKREFDSKSRDY